MSRCIVSVGTAHYAPFITRMGAHLDRLGDTSTRLFFTRLPKGSPTHAQNPYAFKLYAINEAVQAGHTSILWLDSSIIPVSSLGPLWERIETEGHYLWRSGFSVAQSCNDRCLAHFGITRDEAETMPEVAAGVVGLNLLRLPPTALLDQWHEAMEAGMFRGSRFHNPKESKDPRFLFHRQDQSALSCAANLLKMESEEQGNFLAYFPQQRNERTIFIVQGY